MSSYPTSGTTVRPDVNVAAAAVNTPVDRVRWPSIFAGLFAALSTLLILFVLGIAVGASAYDPQDSFKTFGIGAGIWSAISALIAFFVGGFVAAKTAAVRGHGNGTLNGAMVWVAGIPLIVWMIFGSMTAMVRTTAQTVASGASAATDVMSEQGGAESEARQAGGRIEATTQKVANQISQTLGDPENQEQAADTTAKGAWGMLVSLLIGLGAAAAGGYFGSRGRPFGDDRDYDHDRDRDRTRPVDRPAGSTTTTTPSTTPPTTHRP